MWTVKLFLLSWLSQATLGDDDWAKAGKLPRRILELINAYNDRGAVQINDVNDVRADNEKNHPFEMGYVMSEILERYRQMVGLAQRARTSNMDNLYQYIKHTELMQKLYFEIFHLVNMFHEINQKYIRADQVAQQAAEAAAATAHINKILERQKKLDLIIKREKKSKMKQLKKNREMYLQQGRVPDRKKRKPGNRWWPIDYGWEVSYKWW